MKNSLLTPALTALAATLLTACGDPDPSTDIPTERIYARFVTETAADGNSRVRADFFEKDNTFFEDGEFRYEAVYLAGGDTLDVRSRDQSLLFTGGGSHFEGVLPSGILEGTRFEFDLQRAREDFRDAPGAWGTLPAPMDLWLPAPDSEYSVGSDTVTVAWSDAGTLDDMWLYVDVHCVQPQDRAWIDRQFEVDIPGDPGLYAFAPSDYMSFDDACERFAGTMALYRGRAGALDDAYKPDEAACGNDREGDCSQRGYVSIRQVRSVPISFKP